MMNNFNLQINKLKNEIEFAIKNKYSIKIYYTDVIDENNENIEWKYPPYIVKNYVTDKIILEIENYFKNFKNYLIVMYLQNEDIIHKIPINLPINTFTPKN